MESGSYTKLFHPRGPEVRIALSSDIRLIKSEIDYLLSEGFLITQPGLEEGEVREQIGYVLRGSHEKDGETTDTVLLYANADSMTWSFLKLYLGRKHEIEAFEKASGMSLESLPLYSGNDKPQRGAQSKTDKFIIAAPKPFGVIYKKNPKYDPSTEEGKMKPARVFVRWADLPSTPAKQPGIGLEDLGHAAAVKDIYEKAKNAVLTCSIDKLADMQQLVYDRLEEGKLTNEQANELIGIAHARIPDTSKLF